MTYEMIFAITLFILLIGGMTFGLVRMHKNELEKTCQFYTGLSLKEYKSKAKDPVTGLKKILTPKQYSFVFVSFIFILSLLPILASPWMSLTYKTPILIVSYFLVNLIIILAHRKFTPIFDPEPCD